ncbi:MAG: TIGR03032 family protein [Pseudomonadota bacterium]
MTQSFSSQSTDSFAQLLHQAGCSLLVSTYQAGQLVLVRPQAQDGSGGVNTHFVSFAKPMGLATKPGQLAVGGASSITVYRNLPAVAQKLQPNGSEDACYLPRANHITGDIDIHEMAYDGEGELWFVNTRMSCLAVAETAYSFTPRWRPPFISAYELSDRCHLNGLGIRDGRPRYVSMLGASDKPGGWRAKKVSGGQIMDIVSNEVLADGLCMPHSPRWYHNKLWFLSSGAGQLMCAEPGHPAEVVAELPGFARGLAFIDRYALIGLSQVRESAVFAGLPLTRRVAERKSGVWVVDITSGQTVAFLQFTGNVQEVFEVKVLPHRWPMLLDADSPVLATSYELPDEVLRDLAPPDPVAQALEQATRQHLDGDLDQAIEAYRQLLADYPEHPRTQHQLGLCLVDAERWQDAVAMLEQVVERQPDNAEAMNSLGLAYTRLGDFDRGMHWLEAAVAADGQFALAHFNRGIVLLKQGDYARGWEAYDWRWQTPQFVPFQCQQPCWQGEDISGQRLLVHSEQGNGDHVQFMRFLPLAAKRCRELIYVGPENLAPLVAEIEGVSESRVPGQIPADRFDVYCPLMSLPRWLGITLDNLPAPRRYLTVPAQTTVSWLDGAFRVGICWSGSPTHKENHHRSMKLDQLGPLLDLADIGFYSLQMPVSSDEVSWLSARQVINLEPELPGYARTAALIEQLDMVITVDTAVGHVAGALGIPTLIMLNTDPDWRWRREGESSPWYPSVRLVRQATPGDWSAVVDEATVLVARARDEQRPS